MKRKSTTFPLYIKARITPLSADLDEFFNDVDIPKLNDDERILCNGELTAQECVDALNGMARNKSPGYDGITAEIYRKYWHKVGQLVINAFNDSYNAGRLTPVQNRGIISLLHKGKGLPRDKLDNWRPITLLNIDYKIVTKALAGRLQSTIDQQ